MSIVIKAKRICKSSCRKILFVKNAQTYSLFSVYSNGNLTINFGWLKSQVQSELLMSYWQALQEIKGFQHIPLKEDFNYWPSVKWTDAFQAAEDMEKFQQVILGFRDQLAEL